MRLIGLGLQMFAIAAAGVLIAMLLFNGAGFIDGWSEAPLWVLVFAAPGIGMVVHHAWDERRRRQRQDVREP